MDRHKKLIIAGAVAPTIRRIRKDRIVTVVSADGSTRTIPLSEATKGILRRVGIEFGVEGEFRPTKVVCDVCGKLLDIPDRVGRLPLRCKSHPCAECGKPLHPKAFQPSRVARRKGKPALCTACTSKRSSSGEELEANSKRQKEVMAKRKASCTLSLYETSPGYQTRRP